MTCACQGAADGASYQCDVCGRCFLCVHWPVQRTSGDPVFWVGLHPWHLVQSTHEGQLRVQ